MDEQGDRRLAITDQPSANAIILERSCNENNPCGNCRPALEWPAASYHANFARGTLVIIISIVAKIDEFPIERRSYFVIGILSPRQTSLSRDKRFTIASSRRPISRCTIKQCTRRISLRSAISNNRDG